MNARILRIVSSDCAFESTASAQLAAWGDYLPKGEKPPVVFVTGHDAVCPDPRSGELPFSS